MDFEDYQRQRFMEAWESVDIVRPVHYGLFTFGESELPYFLVCGESRHEPAAVTKGQVNVARPMIITPDRHPEFRNFFDSAEEENMAQFLLARVAHFSNLQFDNQKSRQHVEEGGMQRAVDRLNRQLDAEDEDRVAILTAPPQYGGIAVLRYAAQRVWESSADNIQELRDRGFLP